MRSTLATYIALTLTLPSVAFAVSDVGGVLDVLITLVKRIIPLLISIAVLVFFWGIVKFVAHGGDEKKIEEGRAFMIWGMIGLFVIVALWGIVGYIQSSLGLTDANPSVVATKMPGFPATPPPP